MKRIILGLMILALMAGGASAEIWTVDPSGTEDFTTIEAALLGAGPGDTININAGVYNPPGTLAINQSTYLIGAGEGLVTINLPAAGGYGIYVLADDVTLQGFTVAAHASNTNYCVRGGTGSLPAHQNLIIQNVTVSGTHQRAGFDIHGFDNILLSHLTSSDATGGNGVQLTGVVGATLNNITTFNNAWGSISIYCSQFIPRASDDINIDGTTCSLAEKNLFKEDGYGLVSTNITITGYDYLVRNLVYRPGAELFFHYQDTLADATAFALLLDSAVPGSFITPIGGGAPIVEAGMLIQPAIDAASSGDVINIAAGTYPETLNIPVEGISLVGADQATVIIDPTGLATNNAGVYVAADNVTLSTLTVDATKTTSLPRYGLKIGEFDGCSLVDVTVKESYRSGVDCLGSSNLTLTGVTVHDNGGHGLSLVDCNVVAVTDFVASLSGWQNVSVATWGRYSTLGTSGIVFNGTNVFGDLFQLEMGDYNNPGVPPAGDAIITYSTNIGDGADVTVQGSELSFAVHGDQDDGPGQERIWFMSNLTNAALVPANAPFGHWLDTNMFIEDLVDGTQLYVTPGCSIKTAIAVSPVGGTVNVAGGNYQEDGQILADHDVSVIGDALDRAVVTTNVNTGNSGNARGWFLQTAGHLVLRNLELDGTGYDVYQGIRALGTGELDNCALRNIVYPGYAGVALAAFGNGNWDVTGCSFDNIGRVGFLAFGAGLTNSSFVGNAYTGKGAGDWLDYACDISNGAVVNVEGNTITGNLGVASSDGSTSAALLVTTFFGPGTTATINDNVLTGNTTGVACGYDGSDTSIVSGSGNDLSGNASYGVSNSAANWVDFSGNWWGNASGPYHATLNPSGTGVNVDDYVVFEPWSGMTSVAVAPAATGPISCGTPVTLTFSLTMDDYTPDVFGCNVVVRAPAGVNFGTITDLMAFGSTTTFLHYDNGDGSWTFSATTTGSPSQPITSPGTHGLFSVQFDPTVEGLANITLENLLVRDPANTPIPVIGTGATIDVDCTAPAPVTDITAAPAHNKVNVAWTHDGAGVAVYEVYRGLWHDGTPGDSAYPEYNDVNPTPPGRPADRDDASASTEWDLAATVAVGTNTFADVWSDHLDRGVYYYEVFPIDAATNAAPVAAANDRATNYWLGDVDKAPGSDPGFEVPDGLVNAFDMNVLGATFGLGDAHGSYRNIMDVGPTDDWSRLGIPLTDNVINFEDLIVIAMNFGVVSAAKANVPVGTAVNLVWVDYDDGTKALRLEGGRGLKGVRVTANAVVSGVTAGDLLDEQSELTFLKNVGDKLDISVAVMGVNTTFEGAGDLFVVSTDAEISMSDLTITARAIDNSGMKVSLEAGSDAATPRVFALNGNYPNPFNPMTKISFSLPASHDVRLSVYSLDGRKVATLLNETRGPGLHEIVWNGQDDNGRGVASGTYFYRIDAGPYSDVKKMTLMK